MRRLDEVDDIVGAVFAAITGTLLLAGIMSCLIVHICKRRREGTIPDATEITTPTVGNLTIIPVVQRARDTVGAINGIVAHAVDAEDAAALPEARPVASLRTMSV